MKYLIFFLLLFIGCSMIKEEDEEGCLCITGKECICECNQPCLDGICPVIKECLCQDCDCIKIKEYSVACLDCGQEFISTSNKEIRNCPFCPMTEKELDELILELEGSQK
jgi:hypothetical protein